MFSRVVCSYFPVVLAASIWQPMGCNDNESGDETSDTESNADTESDSESEQSSDEDTPTTPKLTSITEEQAALLGAYARRLKAKTGGLEAPIAWSMVNQACQDRTLALQYALAAADPTLEDNAPPPMDDTKLNLTEIEGLAAAPAFSCATINATGPFVTHQALADSDGAEVGDHSMFWYWPYHHGVALNVEGEIRVLDLSIGNAPVPIDEWLKGFVQNDVVCEHLSHNAYTEVWAFWNARFSNFETDSPPASTCGYTFTSIFTFRLDQTPADLADFIASVPSTMQTQSAAFQTIVQSELGVAVDSSDVAQYTSKYEPGTLEEVCELTGMKFCDDL